jgi:transposase
MNLPLKSPDLNLIEKVWRLVKDAFYDKKVSNRKLSDRHQNIKVWVQNLLIFFNFQITVKSIEKFCVRMRCFFSALF